MDRLVGRNAFFGVSGMVLVALAAGCSDTPTGVGSTGAVAGSTGAGAVQTGSGGPALSVSSSAAPSSSEPTPSLTGSAPLASATPSSTPTASGSAVSKPPIPDAGTPSATSAPVASGGVDAGIALPAPAPGSAEAVAAELDALYLPKKTFKARFTQKYKQKITGTEKESHGTVFVEKPNKISFRYDAPNKNRIVSDGSSVKVYIAEDAQMFEQPVKGTEYPGALSFIMGEGIRSSFAFTFNDKAKFDKGPVLVGKPRVASAAYESALFYVDKDKLAKKEIGAMVAVLLLDAQGNRNRFEFSDSETPDKIDAAEFVFTPPAGTNIQK